VPINGFLVTHLTLFTYKTSREKKIVLSKFMKIKGDFGKSFLQYSPILVGIFIMLPRLLSPNFGFFDDASALAKAQEFWTGNLNPVLGADGGRFRPLYWLYYAILYRIFGIHPLGFFIGNLLLFSILIFFTIRMALALGINEKVAWIVGLVFALANPVIENIYTLCKLELLQVPLILLLLFGCELYVRIKKWYWKSIFFLLLGGIAFLVCITKETGVLLIPASLISLIMYWLWGKFNHPLAQKGLAKRIILLWASLIGGIAFIIISSILMNHFIYSVSSGNINFHPDWLYSQFRILVDWMLRDYLYLIPLCLGAFVALFKKSNRNYLPLLLECACWVFVWVSVYIPWMYLPEYYLLPVALISAIICGILISLNINLLRSNLLERRIALICLSLSAILFAITIPNLVTNARLQMAMDSANADMLTFIVDKAPQNSTIWINIQEPNEYVNEFVLWVNQINNRPDLKVDYFHGQDLLTSEASSQALWIVSAHLENQFYPSVRMGVYENTSNAWNKNLENYLNGKGEQIDYIRYSMQNFNFDPMRFFCPLAGSLHYCQVPNNPIDNRIFAYGWSIERIP